MAEHLNQPAPNPPDALGNMGKPVPYAARQAAYDAAREMGLDKGEAMECVDAVAEQLKRDKPYEARHAGARYLDLTGVYRLMATLLANIEPEG